MKGLLVHLLNSFLKGKDVRRLGKKQYSAGP